MDGIDAAYNTRRELRCVIGHTSKSNGIFFWKDYTIILFAVLPSKSSLHLRTIIMEKISLTFDTKKVYKVHKNKKKEVQISFLPLEREGSLKSTFGYNFCTDVDKFGTLNGKEQQIPACITR